MRRYLLCAAVFTLAAGMALGANTIVGWNFEQGLDGWQTPDPQAQLGLAVGPKQAVQGSASLHIKFARIASMAEIQQRGMPGVMTVDLQTPPTPAPTCFDFAIRTKLRTPLIVSMTEADGSNYMCAVTIPPGDWQHVKLYLNTFNLDESSSDENGRLDGDQISRIMIADASFFLVGLSEQAAKAGFGVPAVQAGENEIWLDDVKLTDEAPVAPTDLTTDASGTVMKGIALIDPTGSLARLPHGLADQPCWQLKYHLGERQAAAAVFPTGVGSCTNSAGINVAIQSAVHSVILMQVKEQDGSEYNAVLDLQPGQAEIKQIPWPAFQLGQDSQDENGRLDVDQIKEVDLLDATNIFGGGGPHSNELLIGPLTLAK